MAELVKIRRHVFMVPIFGLPLERVCEPNIIDGYMEAQPNKTIRDWLVENDLSLDAYSDDWTFYYFTNDMTASFFFRDPKLAMMFKLAWA